MNNLTHYDIKYLTGVGPKRAEILAKELDIKSFHDMLYNFPFRYIDRSTIHHICDLRGADIPSVQLKGRFVTFNTQGEGARRRLIGLFSDGTGTMECVWFNRVKSIQQTYQTGVEYIVFGKPTLFNRTYSIVHPEVDAYQQSQAPKGMVGVYNLTEKLRNHGFSSRLFQKLEKNLLESDAVKNIHDPLPQGILRQRRLLPIYEAVHNLHLPSSIDMLQKAQYRMKYEELFFLELHILKNIKGLTKKLPGHVFSRVGEYFNTFYSHHLQFPLTGAQKRVIREIRADMGSGRQMNRLLQGDVGSGKTMVAVLSALIAVGNGYQACIMAPTEVLAQQHYRNICKYLAPTGVRAALLTGNSRTAERREIHAGLEDGSIGIIVGTHALIEDNVRFRRFGLAIVDEQHRFGVEQRAKLWRKTCDGKLPHVLVMTATPIPRTLAMTLYGDLDVSVIDELPPGRKPVQTIHGTEGKRLQMYNFLKKEIASGRQVFIVYPLIFESEKLDYQNLENGIETIRHYFPFPPYKIAVVHGKLDNEEKAFNMDAFSAGRANILVATSVIEVGVDVPNASVMVIESAERFGLSQLHQLRGRVGRGSDKAYCILMTGHKMSKESKNRIELMCRTENGFEIAEEDMKMRGPGDLEGTQQSGLPIALNIASLARDGQILGAARNAAAAVLNEDPTLNLAKNVRLLLELRKNKYNVRNYSNIS